MLSSSCATRPGDFSSGFSFLHTMVRAAASRTPHEADVITWPGAFMVCVATIATIPASTMRREAIRPAIIDDERWSTHLKIRIRLRILFQADPCRLPVLHEWNAGCLRYGGVPPREAWETVATRAATKMRLMAAASAIAALPCEAHIPLSSVSQPSTSCPPTRAPPALQCEAHKSSVHIFAYSLSRWLTDCERYY